MYLNRFTINILRHIDDRDEKTRQLGAAGHHFEELFFGFLPNKTNLAGYGFFHIYLNENEVGEDVVKPYGQIFEYHLNAIKFDLNDFCALTDDEKFHFLVQTARHVLGIINNSFDIDYDNLQSSLEKCLANGPVLKRRLKVSKQHPSKKLRVDIFRVIEPTSEKLVKQIQNSKGEIMEQQTLSENSDIYEAAHQYKKSIWENDSLIILDRFDKKTCEINVRKYLAGN